MKGLVRRKQTIPIKPEKPWRMTRTAEHFSMRELIPDRDILDGFCTLGRIYKTNFGLLSLQLYISTTLRSTFFFPFIFISWRLITLQYCSGFCHTLTWISHGFTCVPHPNPPSRLPLHPIPLGLPSAPALSTCLMHPTWAGDLFHPW